MQKPVYIFLLLLFIACGKADPPPVIFDLVDGVVTTELYVEIPLANHRKDGVTEVWLVPSPERTADTDKISTIGKLRAAAVGNYSLGFAPEVVLTPNNAADRYMGSPSASLNDATASTYADSESGSAMAKVVAAEHAGKRIVLVGNQGFLQDFANAFAGEKVLSSWPETGVETLIHVTAGGEEPTCQVFKYIISREG